MRIILSPWAEDAQRAIVDEIIKESGLDKDALKIEVLDSSENGMFE